MPACVPLKPITINRITTHKSMHRLHSTTFPCASVAPATAAPMKLNLLESLGQNI